NIPSFSVVAVKGISSEFESENLNIKLKLIRNAHITKISVKVLRIENTFSGFCIIYFIVKY
ncbi:MAG: hypothetical protein L0G10_12240, partial [Acinetobacter sp.]|nr:hypothetical protein [Acinetobacter sp.]